MESSGLEESKATTAVAEPSAGRQLGNGAGAPLLAGPRGQLLPLEIPWQDLVLKPWSSWDKSGSTVELRNRLTHMVLYYTVWWILLPLPWEIYPTVKVFPLLSIFTLILVSNNHWRDVQYGGWRHIADGVTVEVVFGTHLLSMDGSCLSKASTPIAMVVLAVVALAAFATAWWRHLHGHIEEGLVWHLLMREVCFWGLLLSQAPDIVDKLAGYDASWTAFVGIHTIVYWMSVWVLWSQAKAHLKISYETGDVVS